MKRKIIQIDPVEHKLYIYVGKDKKYIDIIHEDFAEIEGIEDQWDGFHAFQRLKDGELAHVIYLERMDDGLLIHELVHCVETLMETTRINDEEFRAYTMQHLFYEVKKEFKR